jgi:aminoacylase
MDADGKIFARGSQDMKCVGVQYLEAIRRLRQVDKVPNLRRTVHLAFVPDEEIGSEDGVGAFIGTERFRQLNIGFSLDEGLASPDDVYPVFYGERSQQCELEQ